MISTALGELLADAREQPHGPDRIAAFRRALRQAEADGDRDTAYRVRLDLAQAAGFGGDGQLLVQETTTCLRQHDADPETYPGTQSLLWRCKHLVTVLTDFPQFGREQIATVLDDVARRFDRAGVGRNAAAKLRWRCATALGDLDGLDQLLARWRATERDWLSDCRACDPAEEAEALILLGQDRAAIRTATPVLNNDLVCAEQPELIAAAALLPLLRLGDIEWAARLHKYTYAAIRFNPQFLGSVAAHISYLVVLGWLDRASTLIERHAQWTPHATRPMARLQFTAATAFTLSQLAAADPTTPGLRLDPLGVPADLPAHEQADLTMSAAQTLAAAFDQRNGNHVISQALTNVDALAELQGQVRRTHH